MQAGAEEKLRKVSSLVISDSFPQDNDVSYPMKKLLDTIERLDDEVASHSTPTPLGTSSVDVLPAYSPQKLTLKEGDNNEDRCHSEPIPAQGLDDCDTSTDCDEMAIPKLLDFQYEVQEKFPLLYTEVVHAPQIVLTNITENVFGNVTLEVLESLGRQRVKSSAHRELTTCMYWADIYGATLEVLLRLERAFGIHPLTTEDINVVSTREKMEEYSSNNVRLANVNLLLFHNFVISIHMYPINSFAAVLYNIIYRPEEVKYSEWVAYKFMDAIVDDIMVAVSALQTDVRQIDGFVLQMVGSNSQEDFILRISVARQQIAELSELLSHKRDILVMLSAEKQLLLQPNIKIYLRDILDHVVLMLQQLQHSEDVLNNVNATYLALISIKMAEGSNQMNKVMKRFSAVATIVIPLTLVSSMWGMNVEVPGQTWGLGLLWFFLLFICMSCWFCCALIFFKVKHWL